MDGNYKQTPYTVTLGNLNSLNNEEPALCRGEKRAVRNWIAL